MGFDPNKPYSVVKKEEPTTNDQKSSPSGFDPNKPYKVKKKDVAGTSQTSPSTPSPSGQMPGFAQSRKWDANAVPSTSPSTPQPAAVPQSVQAAKLPNIIYNSNLFTGTGGINRQEPKSLLGTPSSGPESFEWAPSPNAITTLATPQATTTYNAGAVVPKKETYGFGDFVTDMESQEVESQKSKAAFSAETGVPVDQTYGQRTALQKALDYNDQYQLRYDPDTYNYQKTKIESNVGDPVRYQEAVVEKQMYALRQYSNVIYSKMNEGVDILDQYHATDLSIFDNTMNQLSSWPKNSDGSPKVNSQDEVDQYNNLINTRDFLMSNPTFSSAVQSINYRNNQLVEINDAAAQVVRDNPEYYLDLSKRKAKQEENAGLGVGLSAVSGGRNEEIQNPVMRSIVDFGVSLVYAPKAIEGLGRRIIGGGPEKYTMWDYAYDAASRWRSDVIDPTYPMSDSFLSKAVYSGTTMALMALTTKGLSAPFGGGKVATLAATVTSGAVSTAEGYYRNGISAGMTETEAQNYSLAAASVQGALELVNPEVGFSPGLAKRSTDAYLDALSKGASKVAGFKAAGQSILSHYGGEFFQESLQQFSEWGVNAAANQITGSDLEVFDNFGQTMLETAVITAIVSAPFALASTGGITGNMNRLNSEAIFTVGSDVEKYRNRTASMVAEGIITQEKAAEINDKISTAEKIVSKIPSTISPEKAVELIPKIAQKIALEEQRDKSDDSLKPAVEEQITAVSEEIRQTAGIKTEGEKVAESNQKLATEKEAADLEMLSTMGVITPEQQTRLDEIKSAMVPAETTGTETKTTTDATQERIVPENRQQQYQDAQEGGVPAEAGGSNITEQVGQVQQEKVSSETTPVEEAAAAVQRSLASAGINVRTLTEEEAVAEGYKIETQGIFEDDKGQITIVPSRIQKGWGTTVVWHEGAHPILNIIRNTDKPTYDAMVRGLKNLSQNAKGDNKIQIDDTIKFAEAYRKKGGQEGVDDESVAEFIGRVGSGVIDLDALPKSFKQNLINFINSVATKLGLGTVMKDTDTQTLINKAKAVSDVLKSGRDMSEVVGAENVKKFENNLVDENGNPFDGQYSVRASFSDSKTKTQFIYMKDSEKFNQLKSQGYITEDKVLSDYNEKKAVLHSPDAMFSGFIIKDGKVLIEGKGGIWYPINFHDLNRIWASTKDGASGFVNRLNKSAKENNGKALIVLTSARVDKLLSNTTAAIGVVDMFVSKLSDAKYGLNELKVKSALIDAAQSSTIEKGKSISLGVKGLNKSMSVDELSSKIKENLLPDKKTFADRKFFVKRFLSNIASSISLQGHKALGEFLSVGIINEDYKQSAKKGQYKLSGQNLVQSISYMMTEPLLAKDKVSNKAYAIIEIDATADADGNYFKAIDTDTKSEHEAYPKAIVPAVEDGVSIKINVLQDRKDVIGSFVTNSGEAISENNFKKIYPTSGLSVDTVTINSSKPEPKAQESRGNRLFSEPVLDIKNVAKSYKEQNNILTPDGEKIYQLNTDEAKQRADAFESMKHDPENPQVKASYEAMADETVAQFDHLIKSGYSVEIFEGDGEPYANSQEMLDDLRNNKHLFVLSTEKDFGQNAITEKQRQDNPLLKQSQRKDLNGKDLLINDIFRFVHDAFGHGERGNSFGPIGEENAWDVHVRMYTPLAARAMTTETRGQNSWVNFGKHMRSEDGSIKNIPMKDRPFAEQKIGLMPEQFSKGQESRGKRMDVVADTYVQSGLTEDGNDYVFFHVSSADEKSIRKGIDSRKFYSTRTSKSEKGTQYGVASFYTKPKDGERMVGGDKYVVRVSKDKVYPMDTDPKGYKAQVEKTVPQNTPYRAEVVKKKMADLAAKDGYQMAVGEWYYSRTGQKTDMPEFRADALVPLKPTNESASDFTSNEESGMERIAHPEESQYKESAQYEAIGEAVYDYLSEKGRYDDAYEIARDMYMYNKVPTEQEMKTLMKGMPKKITNMVSKTGQMSMGKRMEVAGVKYTELSVDAQEALREKRSKKSFFDNAVAKMSKSDFDKDEIERIIKEENFGIVTGENPMGTPTVSSVNSKLNSKAIKWLESRGYEIAPVTGKYGQTENSFFVPGLTVSDAVEFAKTFNQDGVVTNEGMVYQDGTMNPRTMSDSFNVDPSDPSADLVSAIRTEDGNVMGFKVGVDLNTKVDSSHVAQSAVDTKSTEYAKSSVDKAISERADAKVQDDADTLSAINTTAEEAKSSSIINGPSKISQLKDQVVKAVEDGLISDATAKKVVDDAIKSYDEKVAASKTSIKESIDKIRDAVSKFLFNPEGQYVTNPETGEKIKISKSSIFDVEATVNFATDAIKKAVDKGVDLAVALGNFKSALMNHPTIKNNIANNVISEREFEAMLDAEIAKLIQANALKNKTASPKASKTLERIAGSNLVSTEVKDSLNAQGITYIPDTIAASVSDAQAIVDYFEAEGAMDVLEATMTDVAKSPDVMPHTRALILAEIFDKRVKYSDSIANDPNVSDQAKKAAADRAASTAISFSTINGQYAKSVSIASKRMKQIVAMSPKGLELFVDAQVKMKSQKFIKANRTQRKIKKAIINASKTGNAADAKKSIMDNLMPGYAKLDDKFKTSIDGHLSNAINANGQINKKNLEEALTSYYSGLQMNDNMKAAILSHTSAIKDMGEKEKAFTKIIDEYKAALSGLQEGSPAYKAVVDKYEKRAEDAANAVRDADFKARLEGERLGRQMREGRDVWQSLASIMKLNMLTPQTILINVFGYLPAIVLRGAVVSISSPIHWSATLAMKAVRYVSGKESKPIPYKGFISTLGYSKGFFDIFGGIKYGAAYGVSEGLRKIKYGSTSEDVEKYNMRHSMNAFQAWRDLFSKKSPVELNNVENKISAFIEATFGMPADAMSRLLAIGDKIPFEISKSSKLVSLAEQTYVKNKDGSLRNMNNAEKLEFIFNPPADAAAIADEYAEKMTYQQKNIMSDLVNRSQADIAKKMAEFSQGAVGRHISGFANLLIGTVIPFTKTPVNFLTETFQFTNPAFGVAYSAGFAAKSVKEEKAGNQLKAAYYKEESIRYFSRATVAMGVAMLAANLIKNGLMTGDEDEMKYDAKSMQYENVRARSLNLSALFRMGSGDNNWAEFRKGDFTINYSKMGTMGLALSSWADFYRDKDDTQIDNGIDELMSLGGLGGITSTNIKAMVDQSFMTGIAGVIDAIRDEQGNKVKKFQTNTIVALSKIFIPNTMSSVSKASMDFTKETRTEGKDTELSDMVLNRLRVDLGIMGTADELPSKITLWGEKVSSTPAGTNPWVYYMFDPVQSYSPDTETVGFKIQQMYFDTPKSMSNVRNKMIPSKPDQKITVAKQDVMLTGAEYEQYQILVGTKRKEMVSHYVGSDDWNNDSVEDRAEKLDKIYSDAAKISKTQFIMDTPRLLKMQSDVSGSAPGKF